MTCAHTRHDIEDRTEYGYGTLTRSEFENPVIIAVCRDCEEERPATQDEIIDLSEREYERQCRL